MSGNNSSEVVGQEKKKKIDMKVLFRIITYSKTCFFMIIIAIIFACVSSCLLIWGASRVSDLIDYIRDYIIGEGSYLRIKRLSIVLIIVYLIYLLLSSIQGLFMASIKQKLIYSLRNDIEMKREKLSMSKISSISTGNILSILTNDISKLSQSFSNIVIQFLPSVVLFFGTLIIMFIKSWLLSVSVIFSIILGFVLLAVIMGNSQKYYTKQQETLGRINDHIEEVFSGIAIVKSFNGKRFVEDKFNKLNDEMREANYKTFCYNALIGPLMTLINNLGYITICVVGVILIAKGKITYGLIASFMLFLKNIQEPMSQIGGCGQDLQTVIATLERIFGFIDAEEELSEADKISCFKAKKGAIEFKNVKFGYNPKEKMIIKDFSLKIEPGQKIAIVGHTGAGKTTLINIILRFYEIYDGVITIDGHSIYDITREELRSQFSVVPQDAWIFNGTIRDNIVLSTDNVSAERLNEVCKAVGIDHFISMLSDGYDTVIDEEYGLSQGQKQQISIARAMIADKKILVLDEATSSVDVLLEQKIQRSMDMLCKGKTSIIIAHRLSTIQNADFIIVMKDGNVVESGQHDELLEKGEYYSELYYSQWSNQDVVSSSTMQ